MNYYIPILLQIFIASIFSITVIATTHFIGPKRLNVEKMASFESGIPSKGNARFPIAIRYFMIAIFFVIFDVEIIFLYPWAVNFKSLGTEGFIQILIFISVIVLAIYYILKKNVLY